MARPSNYKIGTFLENTETKEIAEIVSVIDVTPQHHSKYDVRYLRNKKTIRLTYFKVDRVFRISEAAKVLYGKNQT